MCVTVFAFFTYLLTHSTAMTLNESQYTTKKVGSEI